MKSMAKGIFIYIKRKTIIWIATDTYWYTPVPRRQRPDLSDRAFFLEQVFILVAPVPTR